MRQAVDVVELLGRGLVAGEFRPGSSLPPLKDFAVSLSVPRVALREALDVLAHKGLVERASRSRFVIRPRSAWNPLDSDLLRWQWGEPSAEFVRHLYELLRTIEPAACETAAIRATAEDVALIESALLTMAAAPALSQQSIQVDVAFHKAILVASGNVFLAAFAPIIETSLAVAFDLQRNPSPVSSLLPEHEAVFLSIRAGDPSTARELMESMLSRSEHGAQANLHQDLVLV